jgi:hypothetical protein
MNVAGIFAKFTPARFLRYILNSDAGKEVRLPGGSSYTIDGLNNAAKAQEIGRKSLESATAGNKATQLIAISTDRDLFMGWKWNQKEKRYEENFAKQLLHNFYGERRDENTGGLLKEVSHIPTPGASHGNRFFDVLDPEGFYQLVAKKIGIELPSDQAA